MTEEIKVPYVFAYGNITKALEKIQSASTPDRFTQDFLATKLAMKGGSARPVIPFLKRTGFLASNGAPTELYRRFRNEQQRGAAAAQAVRIGFADLYEINEYIHDVTDESELRGVIVQATGLEKGSSTVRAILGSFKALRALADFEATTQLDPTEPLATVPMVDPSTKAAPAAIPAGLNFGYTINLHLPPSSDPAVFSAIFRSLREQLLVETGG
jgi:hypothetical protein